MFILSKNIYESESLALLAANISANEYKILSRLRSQKAFIAMKAVNKVSLMKYCTQLEESMEETEFNNCITVLNRLGLIFVGDDEKVVISKDGIDVSKIIDSIEAKSG